MGWPLYLLDVKNSFPFYMEQPPGYVAHREYKVCKLHKAIYDLKQSPRTCFDKLIQILLQFGFSSTHTDLCLLRRQMLALFWGWQTRPLIHKYPGTNPIRTCLTDYPPFDWRMDDSTWTSIWLQIRWWISHSVTVALRGVIYACALPFIAWSGVRGQVHRALKRRKRYGGETKTLCSYVKKHRNGLLTGAITTMSIIFNNYNLICKKDPRLRQLWSSSRCKMDIQKNFLEVPVEISYNWMTRKQ